jgi:hypothetical protein
MVNFTGLEQIAGTARDSCYVAKQILSGTRQTDKLD